MRILASDWTTIRFANGRIHQPSTERSTYASLRIEDEHRLGVATTTDLSDDGLDRLVRVAGALAKAAPPEPKFPGFPSEAGLTRPVAFSRATAQLPPEAACRAVTRAIDAAQAVAPAGRIAGVLNVGSEALRVTTSAGLDRSTNRSIAQTNFLVEGPDREHPASGWSEGAHWDLRRLDLVRIAREAAERMPTTAPEPFAPGKYRVVLRGPAVAESLSFLGHLGFGAVAEVDGSSCLSHSRGKRIFPSLITLRDDPRSNESLPSGIDYEGHRTTSRALIDRGRVGPAVTDLLSGGRLGRPSSGHGFPPEAPWGEVGPFPAHMMLTAGSSSEEELIRETRSGLLVTRFHYVRTVDPGTGTITGMTRDGTYRIERGEVVGPVRNLRFTESVVSVLKNVSALGRERRIHSGERGTISQTVPAIAARDFRFTSATVF